MFIKSFRTFLTSCRYFIEHKRPLSFAKKLRKHYGGNGGNNAPGRVVIKKLFGPTFLRAFFLMRFESLLGLFHNFFLFSDE